MKAVLVQTDIVWGDPEANIRNAEIAMNAHPGADLYVLPEMFSTGFATKPCGVAEESPCKSLEWMKRYASTHDCAIYTSVALHEDGRFYNRGYFVKPDGIVEQYDKHHLFSYGGESELFTAGERRMIVEFRGVRFLLLICYDMRFPVWIRCRKDYDVILCCANWPKARQYAWDMLCTTRAMENQSYLIGVNRTGSDPEIEYVGGSRFVQPYGYVVGSLGAEVGELEADIDMETMRHQRESFNSLDDADNFELI